MFLSDHTGKCKLQQHSVHNGSTQKSFHSVQGGLFLSVGTVQNSCFVLLINLVAEGNHTPASDGPAGWDPCTEN